MSNKYYLNIKIDERSEKRLLALMAEEYRSKTDTIEKLINEAYLKKHPEEAEISFEEALERR